MAGWQADLKQAFNRLKEWQRVGGIDEHTWRLGMQIIAAMNCMKSNSIAANMEYFSSTVILHKNKIICSPAESLDFFYLGALESLHRNIGIYNDVSEERLIRLIVEKDIKEHRYENVHFSSLFYDHPDHHYVGLDTEIYFALVDIDISEKLLERQNSMNHIHTQTCPAWMAL